MTLRIAVAILIGALGGASTAVVVNGSQSQARPSSGACAIISRVEAAWQHALQQGGR